MHLPSQLAVLIYVGFVVWLFVRDIREQPNVTSALWLPFFWVIINGSRFLSQWLSIFGLNTGSTSIEDGSPIDAAVFFVLIGGGCYVLYQRRVPVSEFFRNNCWVSIFLVYCLLAIVWSDFPLVAFKRWIKLCGQPVMVLVLLTEPDPMESFRRLMKRSAYVILPISILFIKYFPEYGRGFDGWTGEAFNNGIAAGKNLLGVDLMILGLFLFWHLLQTLQLEKGREKRNEIILCLTLLAMVGWLFNMAHSATSLATCLIACMTVLCLGFRFVNKRRIGTYLIVGVAVCSLAEALFGISDLALQGLGKDPTFTGRTEIWQMLLNWDTNPVFGVGFESFWLGERVNKIDAIYPLIHLNEAHNGYLETYLNLGLLGLLVTVGMLLATFFKVRRNLVEGSYFGRFRLGYLLAFLFYNWTEAAFRTHSLVFFIFFLIAMDYPKSQSAGVGESVEGGWIEEDGELAVTAPQNFLANIKSAVHGQAETQTNDWRQSG